MDYTEETNALRRMIHENRTKIEQLGQTLSNEVLFIRLLEKDLRSMEEVVKHLVKRSKQ